MNWQPVQDVSYLSPNVKQDQLQTPATLQRINGFMDNGGLDFVLFTQVLRNRGKPDKLLPSNIGSGRALVDSVHMTYRQMMTTHLTSAK